MKLHLMSSNKEFRDHWAQAFATTEHTVSPLLTFDIDDNSVVFISDELTRHEDAPSLTYLFRQPVMILSPLPTFADAQSYLNAGARGYANAMMHESHLHSAYQTLKEGKVWLHPDFITIMITQIRDTGRTTSQKDSLLAVLSNREQEVAVMLGDARSHQEIADSLHITVRTVKAHAAAIYQKLQVKDRLALSLLLHS